MSFVSGKMGFKKHRVPSLKLIKANPTPHHLSLAYNLRNAWKKKRILQKAEIRKHHKYLWAYGKKVNSYGFSFFQLTKNQIINFVSLLQVKWCAEKSTNKLKKAKTVWIHFFFVSSKILMMISDFSLLQNLFFFFQAFLRL